MSEPFRDNQRNPHLLGTRNRHTEFITEKFPEIGIVNPASDDTSHTVLDGFLNRIRRDQRTTNQNVVSMFWKDLFGGQRVTRRFGDNDQVSYCLATNPEDALDVSTVGLYGNPFGWDGFCYDTVCVCLDFNRNRWFTKNHLSCDIGDGFNCPVNR